MSDGAKESVELLPCPFCGEPAVMGGLPRGVIGQVRCRNDLCFGPRTTAVTKRDSIVQWNRRATPPAAPAGGGSEAVAWRIEWDDGQISFVSTKPDIVGPSASSVKVTPLYPAPAQSAPGHDIEAALDRIISIRNGMTPDMEARAIVRRELAALGAPAQSNGDEGVCPTDDPSWPADRPCSVCGAFGPWFDTPQDGECPTIQTADEVDTLRNQLAKAMAALEGWIAFAEEELSEFEAEPCSDETLCPKCQSSGCILLKITETRAALKDISE